jgi:general secretion pathway protein A
LPLSEKETSDYVRHRLSVAGARDASIFTESALQMLYDLSGGIPRRINQLADMALVAGMGKDKKSIDEAMIKEAASSIGV